MDLTPQAVRDALRAVDHHGWDSPVGRDLLAGVRWAVVAPVVRRSGLQGPAADQAEASGWEAAWDALRRPSARTADNPGGMVWAAVRRAVWAESAGARVQPGAGETPRRPGQSQRRTPGTRTLEAAPDEQRPTRRFPRRVRPAELSLDWLIDSGWQPAELGSAGGEQWGPVTGHLMRRLVDVGWDPGDAADCIALMADDAHARSTGGAGTRWRRAALRIGIPQWRARRLATLLLGDGPVPGVIALAAVHGPEIIHDPAIQAALESTTRRWSAGPVAWLAPWDPDVAAQVGA